MDAERLKALIEAELSGLSDDRVLAQIRSLLVEPVIVLRPWDYGAPGQRYPCWSVLDHRDCNSGIAYCESGFGPRSPWGLVRLESEDPQRMSMGMDSGWFTTFMEPFFESFAATDLPIWRVFKVEESGRREPLTDEGSWESTWARVEACRAADPKSRYYCDHTIDYER